jgi:hypothetical protein
VTFDPTRPTGPQPQPFSPAPPEPANPTPPSAWSAPTGPVVASPPTLATPPALPAAKPKGSSGRWLNLVLAVAAAVAIGGIAFAVGRTTAPVSAATGGNGNGRGAFANGSFAPRASGQPGFGGRGGFGGGAGAGLSINGTVKSVDGNTLTITTANGQTIEVTTGDSTTYHTQAPATAADVKTGSNVQVQLQFNGNGGGPRPNASSAPTGPIGTAGSVTVVP